MMMMMLMMMMMMMMMMGHHRPANEALRWQADDGPLLVVQCILSFHRNTREAPGSPLPLSSVKLKRAVTCDFLQCATLTRVDSDEPVHPPIKLRNSK